MIESFLLSALLALSSVKEDLHCLAAVVHHESRGESIEGQIEVASVVMNRVEDENYPKTVCGVAFQKHQFSGLKRVKFDQNSLNVAAKVFLKQVDPKFKGAIYFHTKDVNPAWAQSPSVRKLGTIGDHKFYARRKNG